MSVDSGGMERWHGVGAVKVNEIRYLGVNVKSNGECNKREEMATGRVEWVDKSERSGVCHKGICRSEKQSLQGGSNTSYVVWFGGGAEKWKEAELEVAELKMLRFSLEWLECTGLEISILEGQYRQDAMETK